MIKTLAIQLIFAAVINFQHATHLRYYNYYYYTVFNAPCVGQLNDKIASACQERCSCTSFLQE